MTLELFQTPILLLTAVMFAAACHAADERVPTVNEIIQGMEKRDSRIEHLHLVVHWKDRTEGSVTSWDRSEIDWDIAGRIRYSIQSGTFTNQGEPVEVRHFVRVYDLQNTFSFDYRYDAALGESKGTETQAIVYKPEHANPEFLRDPYRSSTRGVLNGLEESVAAGREVEIDRIERDDEQLLRIKFLRLKSPSPNALRWTALISPRKDWAVLQLDGHSVDQTLRNSTTVNYELVNDEFWLPHSASWRLYSDDGTEVRGWDCTCEDAEVSDLNSHDERFALNVPAGAWVNFIPLQVKFKTPVELNGIDAIAAAARAFAAETTPLHAVPESMPKPAVSKTETQHWLLIGNLMVGIVLLFLVLKRHRGQ